MRWTAVVSLVACAGVSQGCALLGRGAKLQIEYYDPLPPRPAAATEPPTPCSVAIGRIRASDALRREIEYRRSPYEVGYYETRRWTELPDQYLSRAIDRALFESGQCRRSESNQGVTLDATLVAFEERRAPEGALVAVHVLLHDDRTVLWDATIESARPAPAPGAGDEAFARIAHAMGDALVDAAGQIAQQTEALLRDGAAQVERGLR